ncbi:MAG: glycosyltransferase family 4 protein [Infirmifilum sp.]
MGREELKIIYLLDDFETNYPRDQNYIIKYMMEKGHSVEVLASLNQKTYYDSIYFPKVKIQRSPVVFRFKKAKIYFHPNIVRKLRQVYDVVHSFTFFTYSSLYALSLKSSIKLIRAEIGPPNGLNFFKAQRGIYSLLISLYRKYYDYFTVFNEVEAKSLELLGFSRRNIIILPPTIDFELFSSLQKKNIDDFITIGTIARISPEKGVHRLVPIMKKILENKPNFRRKIKLILAGRIDNSKYAEKVISNLRNILGSGFTYMGEVAPPYEFYKNVDVTVVPSLTETGAIVVLEAMAAGKCVIASDIYPINLYITNGRNGFLFNDSGEAAKLIIDILEGSVDLKSISTEAKKYATKYDYKIVYRKLEEIYYGNIK